jgi:hypothetical protein
MKSRKIPLITSLKHLNLDEETARFIDKGGAAHFVVAARGFGGWLYLSAFKSTIEIKRMKSIRDVLADILALKIPAVVFTTSVFLLYLAQVEDDEPDEQYAKLAEKLYKQKVTIEEIKFMPVRVMLKNIEQLMADNSIENIAIRFDYRD